MALGVAFGVGMTIVGGGLAVVTGAGAGAPSSTGPAARGVGLGVAGGSW
jgi:hypothetical protein